MKDNRQKPQLISMPLWQQALAVGLVLVVLLIGWFVTRPGSNRFEFGADQKIDITPEQIQRIQAIGQWEFLSVSDEEMVDTLRRGFFTDDQLVRIYYGTLRLGVDLYQVKQGWIVARGDTVDVTLPPVGLLDQHFIDEARTKSFYESGRWSASDREAMYERAHRRMLQRGLSDQHLQRARQNGETQVRQVLQSMGFTKVRVLWNEK